MAAPPKFETQTKEVQFSGQASKFFDTRLIGALQKELPGAYFAHFCIYLPYKDEAGKDRYEHIQIGHEGTDEQRRSIMTAEVGRPETMKRLLKALEDYYREGA